MTQQPPVVAHRAALVLDYPLAILKAKLEERRHRGLPVLDLTSGNPAYPPSPVVREVMAKEWAEATSYVYPGYEPLPALAEALATWYEQRCSVPFADKQVVLTAGAKEGIWLSYLVLFNPGDEVLIPNPGYPAYVELAKLFGVVPRTYSLPAESGFIPTVAALDALVTPQTKGIWLNFPSNPTGSMIEPTQLAQLTEWATARGLWILSDYAYARVCFNTSTAPSAFTSDMVTTNVVEIGSASKVLSMAGARVGWIAAHRSVAATFQAIQSQLSSGLPLPQQKAVVVGLASDQESWHESMVQHYAKQRDWVAHLLTKLGVKFELPQASLYIWGEVPVEFETSLVTEKQNVSRGEAYAEWLMATYGIVVVPGVTYGSAGANYIRASYSHKLDQEQVVGAV